MTVFCDGENPTYPAWRLREYGLGQGQLWLCLQNCVAAPSPPDATDMKSGLAWQLARSG